MLDASNSAFGMTMSKPHRDPIRDELDANLVTLSYKTTYQPAAVRHQNCYFGKLGILRTTMLKWFVSFPVCATFLSQVALDVVRDGVAGMAHGVFILTPGLFLASVTFGLYRRKWL